MPVDSRDPMAAKGEVNTPYGGDWQFGVGGDSSHTPIIFGSDLWHFLCHSSVQPLSALASPLDSRRAWHNLRRVHRITPIHLLLIRQKRLYDAMLRRRINGWVLARGPQGHTLHARTGAYRQAQESEH